jgi:CRISPR/Cas system endoribonuclease Cas6 (RAMP superfamily)
MIGDLRPNEADGLPMRSSERNLLRAQQTIYRFLLDIVKKWPPEEVLLEFKRLFLYHVDSVNSAAINAVYEIVFSNSEVEFRNTLKRCCYILVNNWDAARRIQPIKDLIGAFDDQNLPRETISPTLSRLRYWVDRFRASKDFEDLKLFALRYDPSNDDQTAGSWVKRYTSYLLVPQYMDTTNPAEQRSAARALAQQLKDQFKFDLAMYVARSQFVQAQATPPHNPTVLGEEVLRLIKRVVAKRGAYNYVSLANIFINQSKDLSYRDFKNSLLKYLIFSSEDSEFSQTLRARLSEKFVELYQDYDRNTVNDALILRTANRIIESLTTENRQEPAALFVLLLNQGNPMTLVVTLLKVILISPNSRLHLEARLAELIHYYEDCPEDECWWVVNFLEIFNVIFTICAENVQYNLIRMEREDPAELAQNAAEEDFEDSAATIAELDSYRIFSQSKRLHPDRSDHAESEFNDPSEFQVMDELAFNDGNDGENTLIQPPGPTP